MTQTAKSNAVAMGCIFDFTKVFFAMDFICDGFEFSAGYYVYPRALVKSLAKSDDLRRVCDGPARDLTASNFSEIDFLKSIAKLRRVVRFAMNITCLRSI